MGQIYFYWIYLTYKISLRLAVIPCFDRLLHKAQATAKMWYSFPELWDKKA